MTDNNDELIGGEAINAESIGLTKTSPLKKNKEATYSHGCYSGCSYYSYYCYSCPSCKE